MRGRTTNLTLLVALLLAVATGIGAVATGSERGRWVVVAHGMAAAAVVLLVPWKSRVVRTAWRRARPSRWVSALLGTLTVATVLFGLGYATGLVRSVASWPGMWLHVATALALLPLAAWHVLARWFRPRRGDLSRRTVLLLAQAAVLYGLVEATVRLTRLPGAHRRFTGSYDAGAELPVTIWLDDTVPDIDVTQWRLSIVDSAGRYQLSLAELESFRVTVRAILDCTSGWYAERDWTGVPVSALLRGGPGRARSLYVHSVTGYWLRYPVEDLPGLLLATRTGGVPLSPGNGYPLRLVAPDRRGFWWVKWVDRIELDPAPWWWQSPFPLT
jgi:DMSO/TMAO reductase YedYZ molybdopterin-dependent catalytic subunit